MAGCDVHSNTMFAMMTCVSSFTNWSDDYEPKPGAQQPAENRRSMACQCRMRICDWSPESGVGMSVRQGDAKALTDNSGCLRRPVSSASTRGRAALNCCRMPPGHVRSPGARSPPSAGVGSICGQQKICTTLSTHTMFDAIVNTPLKVASNKLKVRALTTFS